MSHEVAFLSAAKLLTLYRDKSLSPVEATKAALAQIAKHNNAVNAYCLVDEERALDAARASETRWAAGGPIGLLDGVPCSVKDLIITKGWPTRRGSLSIDPDQPWTENAPSVDRLLEHGAVLLGKTTTPEFGWKGVTHGPLTGITRNPWDLAKTPGGSSGGAAVAAALGMGALHIGTDAGGSIRIPAAFTGIVGLKATHARVPAYPPSPFVDAAHVGPMTRTVEDAALMLQVMAGPDRRDWQSPPFPPLDYLESLSKGVRGLRIGFISTLGGARVDPEIAAATENAADHLRAMGATIVEADLDLSNVHEVFRTYWSAGVSLIASRLTHEQRERADPAMLRAAAFGASIPLNDYLRLVNERLPICHKLSTAFDHFDLLMTPATPIPAFEAGRECPGSDDWDWTSWTPFSYPFNLSQQPAISIPWGLTSAGLPIGVQLVGPRLSETVVLQAAAALEKAMPFQTPPLAKEG
jgi:aspartyl-tRNA(Asn)/glutamyl-tRNA(Gln) amidotransferase subunit A